MKTHHTRKVTRRRSRIARLGLGVALGLTGCGREFYRNWSDQDVTEAVFEKSRDPRWVLPIFTIEPPSMSRFADPYDPDRPPAPPDDPAAEALSPVPQWPHHRLLIPTEGTGYLKMLEQWRTDFPTAAKPDTAAAPSEPPRPLNLPPSSGRSPFQPPADVSPGPGVAPPSSPSTGIPGASGGDSTPKPDSALRVPTPTAPNSPNSVPPPLTQPPQARTGTKPRQDPGVLLATYQDPATPPAQPGPGAVPPAPTQTEGPPLVPRDLGSDLDPRPDVTIETPPEGPQVRPGAGLANLLAGTAQSIEDWEAAGIPKGSTIYSITPPQALTLALINNRGYQAQLEALYAASLNVTLTRFNLEPQFVAGLSPSNAPIGPNNLNSFLYRTQEAPGGQASNLSIGELAGVSKLMMFGGRVATGFANSVVFNLIGSKPFQPTVQSVIPVSLVQPFLRGGGRAVTLEPLAQSERDLLYAIRSFAQFRQQFLVGVLGTQGIAAGGTVSLGNFGESTTGYLNLLNLFQAVDNQRRTVAAFQALYNAYKQMAEGAGSGLSQLNVDQIGQNLQSQRLSLVNASIQYRNALDNYKIQLGLPPDLPLVVDRGLLSQFRNVFDRIDKWFELDDSKRNPEDLDPFVRDLPDLRDVIVDGRSLIAIGREPGRLEEVLLAAERVALENRLDLMNARGRLYDAWRDIAVAYNDVKGVFTLNLTNQVFTPFNASNPALSTNNPFGFWDQAKQFNLVLNAELPLVRVQQRNVFRNTEITYRSAQRGWQLAVDAVKLQVRNDIRQMVQSAEQYDIQQENFIVNLRQKDNSQRLIFAPPAPGDTSGAQQVTANTQTLTSSQTGILGAQNGIVSSWVSYQNSRLQLYRDLGIMPIDEWEAYYELFPTNDLSGGSAGKPGANDERPPAAGAADPAAA